MKGWLEVNLQITKKRGCRQSTFHFHLIFLKQQSFLSCIPFFFRRLFFLSLIYRDLLIRLPCFLFEINQSQIDTKITRFSNNYKTETFHHHLHISTHLSRHPHSHYRHHHSNNFHQSNPLHPLV
ncbi:hypothetical protein HanIR_Chr14g0683931 [Helianthus annuus]|nr:hypothetical protein HanIR_Chr14g0683931 [Helianthus annuus]